MLLSLEYHRIEHREADIFARFLSETFDNDDLIFFLFVRNICEKELGFSF